MIDYKIIQLHPMMKNKSFFQLTLTEAEVFFQWFMAKKDERLLYLMDKVTNSSKSSFTELEISSLDTFLKNNIYLAEISKAEIIEILGDEYSYNTKEIPPTSTYFIEPTYSICFDIGIYFGEYIIKHIPEAKWCFDSDQKSAYYARPIVVRNGIPGAQACCHQLIENIMSKFYRQNVGIEPLNIKGPVAHDLPSLFKVWLNNFSGVKTDYSWLFSKKKNKK